MSAGTDASAVSSGELKVAGRPTFDVIGALQAGRGVAALVVVAYHAAASTLDFVGPLPPAVKAVFDRGYLGVDFFFVLSGFIIYFTNMGKPPTARWSRRYAESRLVRIFVPYLPIGIGLGAAYMLLPGLSASSREWAWLPTLTLLPSSAQPSLLVAWTLQHELLFYFLFWLFSLTSRPLLGCGLWAAAILCLYAAVGELQRPLVIVLGLINVEFFFGMVVARLVTARVPAAPFVVAGVIAMFAYVVLGAVVEHRTLFGLAIALLLVGIVRAEQEGHFAVPGWSVMLGNASYAIYLVHLPLIALLARVAPPHWLASVILLFAGGALAGIAYHFGFEKPAIAFTRNRLARLWRARTEAAATIG